MNDEERRLISSLEAQEERLVCTRGVEPRRFAAHGGAFPIRMREVGVMERRRLRLAQAEDHAFVIEMIEAFLGV